MLKNKKIVYISPVQSTFVTKDINLLSGRFTLLNPKHPWNNKFLTPLVFIMQAFFLLRHQFSIKAIFIMFAGYWSLLPTLWGRLFNKPVYIILGGTECVSFPSIDYGSLRKPFLRMVIKWSFQYCKCLLPVDESQVKSENTYYEGVDSQTQGFKYFFPKLSTPYKVIHNGFDITFWKRDPTQVKNHGTFITVAYINNSAGIKLKGIDLIMQLTVMFPENKFIIIGIDPKIRNEFIGIPSNLTLYNSMSPEKIRGFLAECEFYLQLSISEGFPNSLCEAMLCECIPIGSKVGGIPFIIGKSGVIISRRDESIIESEIINLLNLEEKERKKLGREARKRIVENFAIDKREKAFMRLLDTEIF
ncbi:MAG: glycosyltransferase family 4 protein [Bacteroidetes bacterium]|nr:glycosyltransferase family 4 protein [Bacteroidota bacterium]